MAMQQQNSVLVTGADALAFNVHFIHLVGLKP